MLYNFELENTSDLMRGLATKLKQRRLECGFAVPRFFVGWIAKNIGLLVKISDD